MGGIDDLVHGTATRWSAGCFAGQKDQHHLKNEGIARCLNYCNRRQGLPSL